MTGSSKILLVDTDREAIDVLAFLARQVELVPLVAYEPITALEIFRAERPGAAIVDVRLTPWDGLGMLRDLRRLDEEMFISVLSSLSREDDKVRALELGADEYIVKPCGHRELVARIRAHMRRMRRGDDRLPPGAFLEAGPLRLDVREQIGLVGDARIRLTGIEARLLGYLMRNAGSVVPTATIARHVWGYDDAACHEAVRVAVHRLRRKLGDTVSPHRFIETLPGIGLRLRTGAHGDRNVPCGRAGQPGFA